MLRKPKKWIALGMALIMLVMLPGCGRKDSDAADGGIPESTGGRDLARAELADNVFSLNSNPNYP